MECGKPTRSPFRIAFVSTMNGCAWGGSEELWSQTALRLAQLGHQVSASVYKWPTRPDRITELEKAGAHLGFRPLQRGAIKRLFSRSLRSMFPGSLEFPDWLWLKRTNPDLVVISAGGPWDGVPWMLACRQLKVPYCPVVQAHSEIWWPLDEELENFRASYRDALLPVFVSHSNRRLLESQCGLRLERARVMFNPLNLRSREEVPWPDDSGTTQIACVGRLEPRAKGQDLLFHVFAQSKWRERPIRLNLFGKGGSERSLRNLASQLQLEAVCFQGHLSDLREIWASNHALILPSRFEGLPLAIVEAMLCARPVITTDVAGNAELVRDSVNGFVAAAPAASLVDEALERAWQRRKNWRQLGLQARRDALSAVPEDPVGELVRKLLSLAGGHGNSAVCSPAIGTGQEPALETIGRSAQ